MTDLFQEPEDATPLEPQEREGLLQTWITHRRDLNEAEQENIVGVRRGHVADDVCRLSGCLAETSCEHCTRGCLGKFGNGQAHSEQLSARSAYRLIASEQS